MSDTTYLCSTDGACATHGPFIWFCHPCHVAWGERNPHTVAAISLLAAGKGSTAAVTAARKLDQQAGTP